jgi:hypothetical protein
MLAAVVLLLPAVRAQASSIFFLRGGNIWVANPDGSAAKQVTTGGSYDFVSSAKTANVIAFHRGGNTSSEYGTLNANGTGLAVNPYGSFSPYNQFFTRLNNAGTRITFAYKQHTASNYYDAGSVGVDGSNPQLIYFSVGNPMDAEDVAFGDPAGSTLLFTDFGSNYQFPGPQTPCSGTDDFGDVLVLQTPGQTTANIFCENHTFLSDPALSAGGQQIAAVAESDDAGSSGRIVTMPIGGAVAGATDQTPLTNITPANSGDSLPDFSPDGTQIVFQGPNDTIYTVSASGGTAKLVLSNASVPAWSPYTLAGGGGVALKLTVTASSSQKVLKAKALVENVTCNLPCEIGAVGQVVIKSSHKTYRTKTVYRTLSAGHATKISLALSSKALNAIRKALAHGKRVTAQLGAVTRQGSKTIIANTSFRIRH